MVAVSLHILHGAEAQAVIAAWARLGSAIVTKPHLNERQCVQSQAAKQPSRRSGSIHACDMLHPFGELRRPNAAPCCFVCFFRPCASIETGSGAGLAANLAGTFTWGAWALGAAGPRSRATPRPQGPRHTDLLVSLGPSLLSLPIFHKPPDADYFSLSLSLSLSGEEALEVARATAPAEIWDKSMSSILGTRHGSPTLGTPSSSQNPRIPNLASC